MHNAYLANIFQAGTEVLKSVTL